MKDESLLKKLYTEVNSLKAKVDEEVLGKEDVDNLKYAITEITSLLSQYKRFGAEIEDYLGVFILNWKGQVDNLNKYGDKLNITGLTESIEIFKNHVELHRKTEIESQQKALNKIMKHPIYRYRKQITVAALSVLSFTVLGACTWLIWSQTITDHKKDAYYDIGTYYSETVDDSGHFRDLIKAYVENDSMRANIQEFVKTTRDSIEIEKRKLEKEINFL